MLDFDLKTSVVDATNESESEDDLSLLLLLTEAQPPPRRRPDGRRTGIRLSLSPTSAPKLIDVKPRRSAFISPR